MLKACSKCGRIHPYNYVCTKYIRANTEATNIRSKSRWHKKAEEIKEHSKYLCQVCKDNGIYTYNNLEAHHIIPINEDSTKAFDNYNILCVCSSCHKECECGKIPRTYQLKLAREREDNV